MKFLSRLIALATAMGAGVALSLAATPARAVSAVPRAAATTGGTQLWVARFAGGSGGVAVSPTGSAVFVTGGASVPGETRKAMGETLAYDPATGATLWRASYHPGKRSSLTFANIAVSPDGSTVFVASPDFIPSPEEKYPRYLIVAYNAATGAQLWADKGVASGNLTSLAVSPDSSTVFVTGGFGGEGDETFAYNAATGAEVWAAGPGFDGESVVVSPDGSTVFVTGGPFDAPATVAYNATTGAELWTVPSPATGPVQVAVSPDGSTVFMTGAGNDTTNTVAYNAATGAALWTSTIAGTAPATNHSGIYPLVVSPNGATVFVTTTGLEGHSGATVAYNAATGTTLWSVRGNVIFPDIAVSPDGSEVFIAGEVPRPGASRLPALGTVAFNATTGARLWVAHYSHSDNVSGIAVSPDGSTAFVIGGYSTLAYRS